MLTYQEEKNACLEYMLNKIYSIFQADVESRSEAIQKCGLEMYLTPDCNQSCSYCYLCKYKDELYPKQYRDPELILKNLRIFLDYCIEKKLNPPRFDLFSGEIWDTQFGYDVLQVVYEATVKGFKPEVIVIPSNFSFVLKDEALAIIDDYMNKFKQINIRVCWSCSNDGKYIDAMTRPFNNEEEYELKKGTDAYYDRIFKFCEKWQLGFHPMVSAHGIEYWRDNFDWWMDKVIRYNTDALSGIMFLEVRNDDWTEEKIHHYLLYLNHCVDYYDNFFKTHPIFAQDPNAFRKWIHHQLTKHSGSYSPLFLTSRQPYPGCTIQRTLAVRMGDLAIVPCHRTSYQELVGGYYIVENDKIVGVQAENIQMMNQIWCNNMSGMSKCGSCPYTDYCLKGCYGAQLEATGELLYPCSTVCDLYQARLIFLYHKYKKLNLISKECDSSLYEIMEKIKDSKEYQKWTTIASQII